jgi:hypothetical protein
MKYEYAYLLQVKGINGKWTTVYAFELGSEMKKRAEEYKGFWANRKVRVKKNPKWVGKRKLSPIPKELAEGI